MCLGPSMLPTFNRSGDVVLMEHVSVMRNAIETGDVVIAKSPSNPRHTVCKRVLGRGGDVIHVPKAGHFGGTMRVEVPTGHLWLQGDNKDNSTDSRDYGPERDRVGEERKVAERGRVVTSRNDSSSVD
jgi:mitochondrial inner membrane protease subunit 1